MRTAPILSVVFAITMYLSTLAVIECRSPEICVPCIGIECEQEPAEYCDWGETRNVCRRRVCAKGPGQRCGGRLAIHGKCGAGMWCKKEEDSNEHTCHGCFEQTFECHPSGVY